VSRRRIVIVGGGTAGCNAIQAIRERDRGAAEIVLVGDERPNARMVLPYYLAGTIGRARVFTLPPARLAELGVRTAQLGRRAVGLDAKAQRVALDDGSQLAYDALLVATGSSAAPAPVPGADGPGVHPFWTLPQADALSAALRPGCEVAVVGAGFIAFTILNALVRRGARVTLVELAPTVLPNMIDAEAAARVVRWLEARGVRTLAGVRLEAIEPAGGRRVLLLAGGGRVEADAVVMATGIRANLAWLEGTGAACGRGLLVDDHQRTSLPNVFAAGDVAEGFDRVTGARALHALEPTAMEHGRVAGANMAGDDVAYRGSVAMNIVDAQGLEVASLGHWNDAGAEAVARAKERPEGYRKLLFAGGGARLTGAILVATSRELRATNHLGMLKGLVHGGAPLGPGKARLLHDPWDIERPYAAAGAVARLLPETLLGAPSVAGERVEAPERAPDEAPAGAAQVQV
jgi:NAD(P)H-nitrite reductase large subunit